MTLSRLLPLQGRAAVLHQQYHRPRWPHCQGPGQMAHWCESSGPVSHVFCRGHVRPSCAVCEAFLASHARVEQHWQRPNRQRSECQSSSSVCINQNLTLSRRYERRLQVISQGVADQGSATATDLAEASRAPVYSASRTGILHHTQQPAARGPPGMFAQDKCKVT